jgi:hypothetical protein
VRASRASVHGTYATYTSMGGRVPVSPIVYGREIAADLKDKRLTSTDSAAEVRALDLLDRSAWDPSGPTIGKRCARHSRKS